VLGDIGCSGNGVFNSGITVLGDIGCSGTGVFASIQFSEFSLPSLPEASGSLSIDNLVYQNNEIKSVELASSGSFISPLQLLDTDSEYQFLYPTGTSIVYLPNGTGLYMGKKFVLVNMDNIDTINVRKSGELSNFVILYGGYETSIVHAGDNNWIKLSNNYYL